MKTILSDLGFQEIAITPKDQSDEIIRQWNVVKDAEKTVFSAYIEAAKPRSCEFGIRQDSRSEEN